MRRPPSSRSRSGAVHRLSAADAVHLATAVGAGADRFLTNNRRDFPRTIAEIAVVYPDELADASLSARGARAAAPRGEASGGSRYDRRIATHGDSAPSGADRAAPRSAPGDVRVRRALLSVSDKRGIVEFARGLADARRRAGLDRRHRPRADAPPASRCARSTSSPASRRSWTGASRRCTRSSTPACSRCATTPSTCRRRPSTTSSSSTSSASTSTRSSAPPARASASDAEVIENIDIGGPTMIRAAAKNHAYVAVVTTPRELRRDPRRAARLRLPPVDADAREPRRRRLRDDRALRHRDRALVRRAPRRRLPAAARARLREGARAAPTARTPTSAPPTTRRSARARTCSRWCASTTARRCRSTTCSTSTPRGACATSSSRRPRR